MAFSLINWRSGDGQPMVVPSCAIKCIREGNISKIEWTGQGQFYPGRILLKSDNKELLKVVEIDNWGTPIVTGLHDNHDDNFDTKENIINNIENDDTDIINNHNDDDYDDNEDEDEYIGDNNDDDKDNDAGNDTNDTEIAADQRSWQIGGQNKVQLSKGHNVFIDTQELKAIEMRKIKKPSKLLTALMRKIIGKDLLKKMSFTGRGGKKPIPKDVIIAADKYVLKKFPKKPMARKDKQKCLTGLCRNTRQTNKKKNLSI